MGTVLARRSACAQRQLIGVGEKFDQGKGQELPTGGFASVPPNHPHFAWVGGTETVVQVHGVGPTDLRFVNPEDDPRKKS